MLHKRTTLRQLLTIPYVLLVMLTALLIGILSYRAGGDTVDTLSDLVLKETVNRISQSIDRHISGSEAVLETAFPSDISPPVSVEDELDSLRTRLWLATSIHRNPNNYAYYGDKNGQFIGLWRFSETDAELRVRKDAESARSIYRFSRINGDLGEPTLETTMFDPRVRPWFIAGKSADKSQRWTSIYIDFKTRELVATRAARVDNSAGEFQGVVATDLSLEVLNEFLKTLSLSENGVAFIVERNGDILASSRGSQVSLDDNGRVNAANSGDSLIASTYAAVLKLTNEPGAVAGTQSTVFEDPGEALVQAGYSRLEDAAGLDWIVAVAVPRADFMSRVNTNMKQTVVMALIACALIVITGFCILNRIAGDLRQLAVAAQAMGEGDLSVTVPVERDDEIGELAQSFSVLRQQLLTDRLTGIANRDAIVRRVEDRIVRHRRRNDEQPFALLFIDLNDFKGINDQHGHDIGDQVLVEVADRLSRNLRSSDMAARFGGDEFVVLLDEIDGRDNVKAVCQNLKASLLQPFDSISAVGKGKILHTQSAAIGFAVFPEDGRELETLMKHADAQMYAAKSKIRSLDRTT